jgi:flagella basal body P-ring formation protein FlgA
MAKNKNIDDDTRARARKFVEEKAEKPEKEYRSDPYSKMTKAERDARVGYPDDFPPAVVDDATKRIAKPKPRVVSKKELEESGLSLRDFLNKERGLTRREDKVEAAKKQLKLGEKVSAEDVDKAKKQLKLAKGGYVNCGASVPPAQKAKK